MPKTTTQPDIIYLKEYEVTSDFFSSSLTNQIDLSYLLNVALETAGHHDRHVNDYLPNPLLKRETILGYHTITAATDRVASY